MCVHTHTHTPWSAIHTHTHTPWSAIAEDGGGAGGKSRKNSIRYVRSYIYSRIYNVYVYVQDHRILYG